MLMGQSGTPQREGRAVPVAHIQCHIHYARARTRTRPTASAQNSKRARGGLLGWERQRVSEGDRREGSL